MSTDQPPKDKTSTNTHPPASTSTSTRKSTSRPSDTTTTTTSKRTSLPPRPPLSIHPSVIIGPHVQIIGHFPVRIDANCIIHPYAKVQAWAGEVRIGEGCIVSERVLLGAGAGTGADEGNSKKDGTGTEKDDRRSGGKDVVLGRNVVLESGAVVDEGCQIGEMSVVDIGVKIGAGSVVGRYCKITSTLTLLPASTLHDYTILYGTGSIATMTNGSENDDPSNGSNKSGSSINGNSGIHTNSSGTYAQRIDTTTRDRPDVIPALKIKAHSRMLEMQRRLVENHVSKWQ